MPPSCLCPNNGTRGRRMRRSRVARRPRPGRRSQPKTGRRTRMRAGPRSMGRSFYGYKNHVNADAMHKLIRRYDVSDAAVHDSQKLDALLNKPTGLRMCSPTAPIARPRLRRGSRPAAFAVASTSARRAIIRSHGGRGSKPEEEQDSSSHRACVWSSADLSRQPAGAHDRHRQSASQDRIAEPRVQRPPPRDVGADSHSMREKSACAALNRTPSANGGALPASDHLSIAHRSAQADDHATKTLLFEVPLSIIGLAT